MMEIILITLLLGIPILLVSLVLAGAFPARVVDDNQEADWERLESMHERSWKNNPENPASPLYDWSADALHQSLTSNN